MNQNILLSRAFSLARSSGGSFLDVEISAEQIFQTMLARPAWNLRRWIAAVEMAAEDMFDDGYVNLMGPTLERWAEQIYLEEL